MKDILMQIRPTARVVLLNSENKVLLLHAKINNNEFWLTPGGKIEDGESALIAAKRELFEEAGIENAQFLSNSHVFYYERIVNCDDVPMFFKEHIFVAYALETRVHFDNLMEYERNEIAGFTWWDIADFIEKKEVLFPETLAEDIQNFIEQKVVENKENIKEI